MTLPSACTSRPLRTVGGVAALAIALGVGLRWAPRLTAQDASPSPTLPAVAPQGAAGPIALPAVAATPPPSQSSAGAPAPPVAPQTPAVQPSAATPAPLPASEVRMQLAQLTAELLHDRLERAFGKPLPRLASDGTPWLRFSVEAGGDSPVLVAANQQTGEVRLVGRPAQLKAWREIILALDAPTTGDRVTQLVAADRAAASHIKQTVGLLLAQAPAQAPQANPPQAGEQPQPEGQPQPGAQAPGAQAAADGQGLMGPVQIEVVEGTDLFVIRGAPRDVQRVMEVIRQIEEMSRVSEPQVIVHPLKFVGSDSMARLVAQLFGPVPEGGFSLGPFYGPLMALPLGKPNAVLLVGGPDAVGKAQELLGRLDIAGETLTQFQVFRLKSASAEQARVVIERMFAAEPAQQAAAATTPPFTPKALVIAEPRTNSLIVRASPRDMDEVRAMLDELDRPGGETVNEIRVFHLQNTLASDLAGVLQRAVRGVGVGDDTGRDADGLATLLRLVTVDAEGRQVLESGVLAGVTVNADARANSLIVSAPPESMPLMAALIQQLDVAPNAVAQLKVFTIENGDAVSLAEMLRGLFGAGQEGGNQGGGGGGGNQNAAGNRIFQLRFEVDERTNSIIAAGSSDELLVVEAVLLRLDASDSRQRINRVYKLKNADAEQVALALQQWLQQKREIEATAPGVTSPFQQIEREVVIVAEINSNSLIVSATPTYYNELSDIIRQVDEEAPIVMIQVLIGEVRLGDTDEFGVEFGLQDSVLFDRSLLENISNITTTTQTQSAGGAVTNVTQQTVQAATLTPGFNFGDASQQLGNSGSATSVATAGVTAAQGISSFGVGRLSQAAGFGGLVLSASSESISMLLRALQESQRLEVLSRPQIMALDNQTGRAFVGQVVPYITASTIDQIGQRTNTITFRDVGLELLVRPRISPDNLVVMEIYAAKDELGSVADGVPISIAPNGAAINAPIIDSISAETTVSALSGQTVVLSGLLLKRDRELHRRVPLIADIPLIGDLFKFDAKQVERSELLIVLTPRVIRSRYESERLKQIESSRMSWCLSDVVDMHGPAGLRSRQDTLGAAEAETVYPTVVPDENGGFAPQPAPPAAPPTPADDGGPAMSAPADQLPPPAPSTP